MNVPVTIICSTPGCHEEAMPRRDICVDCSYEAHLDSMWDAYCHSDGVGKAPSEYSIPVRRIDPSFDEEEFVKCNCI